MPRQIRQLPKLFGFLVSQIGLMQLVGKRFQRSEGRHLRIVLALLASSSLVQASFSITVEWDPSPDTNVIGYVLYHGAIGGSAVNAIETGNQPTARVRNLFGGTTNFFYVVAHNTEAVPSVHSKVVVASFPGIYSPPTISAIPASRCRLKRLLNLGMGASPALPDVSVSDSRLPSQKRV
jgi:hypothetical protein